MWLDGFRFNSTAGGPLALQLPCQHLQANRMNTDVVKYGLDTE
jgi:hypothetical protein